MKTIKIIVEGGVVQNVIFPNGYKNCLDYEVIDEDQLSDWIKSKEEKPDERQNKGKESKQ